MRLVGILPVLRSSLRGTVKTCSGEEGGKENLSAAGGEGGVTPVHLTQTTLIATSVARPVYFPVDRAVKFVMRECGADGACRSPL